VSIQQLRTKLLIGEEQEYNYSLYSMDHKNINDTKYKEMTKNFIEQYSVNNLYKLHVDSLFVEHIGNQLFNKSNKDNILLLRNQISDIIDKKIKLKYNALHIYINKKIENYINTNKDASSDDKINIDTNIDILNNDINRMEDFQNEIVTNLIKFDNKYIKNKDEQYSHARQEFWKETYNEICSADLDLRFFELGSEIDSVITRKDTLEIKATESRGDDSMKKEKVSSNLGTKQDEKINCNRKLYKILGWCLGIICIGGIGFKYGNQLLLYIENFLDRKISDIQK
jgi:hypothetical protein